jgi:hypothetical protein
MNLTLQKEQFSKAFVHAISTVAGFKAGTPPEIDDDSVDYAVSATGGNGTLRSPKLEMQLKCTETPSISADGLHYPLKIKNYRDLIPANLQVPRILVVLNVPDIVASWINQTPAELALHHCAYWVSLRGLPPSDNDTTVTVTLPSAQLLTVTSLTAIMGRIAAGGLP